MTRTGCLLLALATAAALCSCAFDLQGATCSNNRECPRQQFCARDGTCQTGQTPIDYACERITTVLAARLSACVGGRADLWLATAGASTLCEEVVQSVAAGRMTYDEPSLEDCKDAIAARSCTSVFPPLLDGCAALIPAVPAAQACTGALDCSGGFCDTSATCPGTCKAYVQVGAACGTTDQCVRGASCRQPAGGGPKRCLAWAGAGEACGFSDCEPTLLFCDSTNHCAPRVTAGACNGLLCSIPLRAVQDLGTAPIGCECAQQFNCVDPGGGAQCQAAKKEGEACVPGRNECALELTCKAGVCAAQSRLREQCGSVANSDYIQCAEGQCSGGTCGEFRGAGQACDLFNPCGPNAVCDQATNTCAPTVCPGP